MHNNAIKFWRLESGRLRMLDCQLGKLRRFINCVAVEPNDVFAYCGTRLGDVIEVSLDTASYSRTGPVKRLFQGGIHQINCAFPGSLVLSTAGGLIARVNRRTLTFEDEADLHGGPVVSLTNSQEKIYALTAKGNLHSVGGQDPLAAQSCFMGSQTEPVAEIAFPAGYGELFAIRCKDELRLWNVLD